MGASEGGHLALLHLAAFLSLAAVLLPALALSLPQPLVPLAPVLGLVLFVVLAARQLPIPSLVVAAVIGRLDSSAASLWLPLPPLVAHV